MKTVQDLIDELMQIEDKSKPVTIWTCWDQIARVGDWEVSDFEYEVQIGGDC